MDWLITIVIALVATILTLVLFVALAAVIWTVHLRVVRREHTEGS